MGNGVDETLTPQPFTWGGVGPAVTAFSDLLCERGVAGPVKRHTAVHQGIEQNSQGPAVHLAYRNTHMLKWDSASLVQHGRAGSVDALLCKQARIVPPQALDKAALSRSLEQHKVDFHSRSVAESPFWSDWKDQSQPAADNRRGKKSNKCHAFLNR